MHHSPQRVSVVDNPFTMPEKQPKRRPGRPAGEKSTVVPVRIPISLLELLNQYVDKVDQSGLSTNRGTVIRDALKMFLRRKSIKAQ